MVNYTHVEIGHAIDILASAVDMETGMRGYLLAAKDSFLEYSIDNSLDSIV